jgi:hypothetical protein
MGQELGRLARIRVRLQHQGIRHQGLADDHG